MTLLCVSLAGADAVIAGGDHVGGLKAGQKILIPML